MIHVQYVAAVHNPLQPLPDEILAAVCSAVPSRFVLELGDAVTRLDEHIGSSGERNGVIAA